MKKIIYPAIGFTIGLVLSVLALFGLSYGLEYFGIQLYSSEQDQQRNFNFFLVFSLVVSLMCAWLGLKKVR